MESHLLQMRGLKLAYPLQVICTEFSVASFTDAWIETRCFSAPSAINASRIFYRCVD